jgi:hypothetical protein
MCNSDVLHVICEAGRMEDLLEDGDLINIQGLMDSQNKLGAAEEEHLQTFKMDGESDENYFLRTEN